MMEFGRFDLHMHSACSDGTQTPGEVVRAAEDAGVLLMALTDHDCMAGVAEACAAGAEEGVRMLPGVEFDCEWAHELHMLGLGLDPNAPGLRAALETAMARRNARNAEILARLKAAGYDIADHMPPCGASVTRQHIAFALIHAGYAENLRDAFTRYLEPGCPGYYRVKRLSPDEAIAVIHAAGGTAVWAHPVHKQTNVHAMTEMLSGMGLDGLEAYHPSASEGDTALLVSLAAQYGLLVTCGSDSHGASRPSVHPGCTWRDVAPLRESFAYFVKKSETEAKSRQAAV